MFFILFAFKRSQKNFSIYKNRHQSLSEEAILPLQLSHDTGQTVRVGNVLLNGLNGQVGACGLQEDTVSVQCTVLCTSTSLHGDIAYNTATSIIGAVCPSTLTQHVG